MEIADEEGRARLAETALGILDVIEEKLNDGETVRIGQVVVVAEVFRQPAGDGLADDGLEPYNGIEINSSDWRAWTVYGLLGVAAQSQFDRLGTDLD